MAAGDVMLGRTIGERILSRGTQWPFYRVQSTLAAADFVLVNLECDITYRGTRWPNKSAHFRGPNPAAADALDVGGIDFVSNANNHAMDYGAIGMADTISVLNSRAIGHSGAGPNRAAAHAPYLVTVNGLRLAILSYVKPMYDGLFSTLEWEATATKAGVAIARRSEVAADVTSARTRADVVIVFFHYGKIGQSSPNKNQLGLSRAALTAGAALVVGAHAHQLQGYASTAHTLVAYGLGNFVFDGFSGVSNDSVILDVTLTASGVSSFRWIPVVVDNGRPRLAAGAEVPRILARIPNISAGQ